MIIAGIFLIKTEYHRIAAASSMFAASGPSYSGSGRATSSALLPFDQDAIYQLKKPVYYGRINLYKYEYADLRSRIRIKGKEEQS